jgi:ATP-dependent Lon protease
MGGATCLSLYLTATGRYVLLSQMSSTGAVTLSGRVFSVDGISEKITGAMDAGQRAVLLPRANAHDVVCLPAEVQRALDLHLVSDVDQALRSGVVGEHPCG